MSKLSPENVISTGLACACLSGLGIISFKGYEAWQKKSAANALEQARENAPIPPLTPARAVELSYTGGIQENSAGLIIGWYDRECLKGSPYDPISSVTDITTEHDMNGRLVIIDIPVSGKAHQLPLRFFGFNKQFADLEPADKATHRYLDSAGCD